MIKILIIQTSHFGYDGITNVITNYYTFQDKKMLSADIVTIDPVFGKLKNELAESGGNNYVLEYRNSNPFKYLINLTRIIRKGNYQIVHVHGCSSTMAVELFAAKLAGVKVRIAHSHNTKSDHMKIDILLRPIFERLCNCRFACGKEAGEWLFGKQKFRVIPNGIDINRFGFSQKVRDEVRRKNDWEDKLVVGHIGRLSYQKNHEKLLDIFAEFSKAHSNAVLILIGDGELKDVIERKAVKLKINVLFIGTSDEVEKWLQAIDIIIFPSLFEGLPLSIVEAQAADVPCILSSGISAMTKITDAVRFVDLNADEKDWCLAAEKALENHSRTERVDYVRKMFIQKNFDIRSNCKKLDDVYKKLAERASVE